MSGGSAERIHESFARQGLMTLFGAKLQEIAEGRCVVTVPFSDGVTQQHAYFHGAVIGSVADVAGGYAALSAAPEMGDVLTVEYKVNFVRPARGESLRATAEVVARSRRSVTCRADVWVTDAGADSLCAVSLQTLLLFERTSTTDESGGVRSPQAGPSRKR